MPEINTAAILVLTVTSFTTACMALYSAVMLPLTAAFIIGMWSGHIITTKLADSNIPPTRRCQEKVH